MVCWHYKVQGLNWAPICLFVQCVARALDDKALHLAFSGIWYLFVYLFVCCLFFQFVAPALDDQQGLD